MSKINKKIEQCNKDISKLRQAIEELRGDDYNYFLDCKQQKITDCDIKVVKELKGQFGKIYACQQNKNDSKYLVSASQEGSLMIQDTILGTKAKAILLNSAQVMSCSYSPFGSYVCCGGLDNLLSVFNVEGDGKMLTCELSAHEGYISCCQFLFDDSSILTSSGDKSIILWDINTSKAKQKFIGHEFDVMSVSAKEDGTFFISGSCDSNVKLWDIRASDKPIFTFLGHESDVNSVKYFPDSLAFASGSDDSTCRMFDLRSLRQLNIYKHEQIVCGVTSVTFSYSGHYLFAAYDDFLIYVWDTLSGKFHQKLNDHKNRVSCLDMSPNGQALASGSQDQSLYIQANDSKSDLNQSRLIDPNEEF